MKTSNNSHVDIYHCERPPSTFLCFLYWKKRENSVNNLTLLNSISEGTKFFFDWSFVTTFWLAILNFKNFTTKNYIQITHYSHELKAR